MTVENNRLDNKTKNIMGLVLLVPVLILCITYLIVPLIMTIYQSFTYYNAITEPVFVKLTNYRRILFEDDVFKISLKNTVMILMISTPITVVISFFFAWLSSRFHSVFKYILSILFMIVSINSVIPTGLIKIFSSSIHGYINVFLNEPIHFIHNPTFIRIFSISVPLLLGIGPLFLIFTIYFMNRNHFYKYLHLAITLQVIIVFLSFMTIQSVSGIPSIEYAGHMIHSHIFDYFFIRYEIGYASALTIVMGFVLIFFMLLYNGIIWLFSKYIKVNGRNTEIYQLNIVLQIIIFIFLFVISIILMYPYIQIVIDSFKPLSELYNYPPKLFMRSITLEHYKNVLKDSDFMPFGKQMFNSVISLFISTIITFIIVLLSSIGLHLMKRKMKKTILIILITIISLSPVFIMTITKNNIQSFEFIIPNTLLTTFRSATFGLSILIGWMIFNNLMSRYNKISQFLSSKSFISYIFGIASVSLISSLSTWFNILYRSSKSMRLIQSLYMNIYLSNNAWYANYASFYVLSMIIPILIIIICIPILIYTLTKNQKLS